MEIREYRREDCRQMTSLFYDTVHAVNAADYTEEELNAWADGKVDYAAWDASFQAHYTLTAQERGILIGFGDIDQTGYLDRLYVHKDYQGKGVASALCDKLERHFPVERLVTHASITALPFFQKRGYRVVKEQKVERKGILLTNYICERSARV